MITRESEADATRGRGPKVAYVVSRFPKLTETFVLNEILAMESLGAEIELYPLLRERQAVLHPEAARWTRKARYLPFLSRSILGAQLHFLRRRPRAYLRTWIEVLRGTWGSANFFFGAIAIFPKAVRIARELPGRGVTHVHAHFSNHPTVAALVIHRLTGIPFSFTAHGFDIQVDRRMLDVKVDASAFAVAIAEFNKELMLEACGAGAREKIRVIHCGIDPRAFSPARARRRAGALRIACVAALVEPKGHAFLVEACRILRERGVPFRCHLVGEGPFRGELESRIARAGLRGRVRLHGALPSPAVASLLRRTDVAVLASYPKARNLEGIPVALMEAMACGLPVVATRIGGVPELVEDGRTGYVVPPGDAAALAEALERLARDAGRRETFGRNGREKVLREFDLRENARELLRLFDPGHPLAAPVRAGAAGARPARSGER